jgi:glycosyltransferase involved in cell wall biosynthesis
MTNDSRIGKDPTPMAALGGGLRRRPAVSVCIPAYQGERFIAETVANVLAQTFTDFELVVLDNACTDRTAEIVTSFPDLRIRLERNPTTLPLPENWNRAVALCRAPLIKLVCADDLLHPRCLELQAQPMLDDPDLALVACRQHMVDEQARVLVPNRSLRGLLGRWESRDVIRRVVRNGANPLGSPASMLFRRTHFDATGGFDGNQVFTMDLDMYVRLLEHGGFLGLREALAGFRLARGSVSGSAQRRDYLQQREMTTRLAQMPDWHVRPWDRAVGRVGAPLGQLRRRALFALSNLASRANR